LKAALYLRVSSTSEITILRNQERAALDYARRRKIKVVARYQDIASATSLNRQGMNALISEASPKKFDVVIFTALSRMTRGGVEAGLYCLKRLKDAGVGWHFVEQPSLNMDADTPELVKDVFFAIHTAMDKDYVTQISKKVRWKYQQKKNLAEARGEKVKWGRPPGSKDRRPRKIPTPPALRENRTFQ
jgi:DNA invertase Pin-like site-specific DNA recombinase